MEKKIIWGGLAGGVAYFLLGWLLYGILLKDYFASASLVQGVNKEVPDFAFLIIGNLALGFLFAIIIGRWANVSSMGDAIKVSFTTGLLIGVGYDMIIYSTSNLMSMSGVIADIGVTILMSVVVGSVIATVMGVGRKMATA
jgi:hypothetical protein